MLKGEHEKQLSLQFMKPHHNILSSFDASDPSKPYKSGVSLHTAILRRSAHQLVVCSSSASHTYGMLGLGWL